MEILVQQINTPSPPGVPLEADGHLRTTLDLLDDPNGVIERRLQVVVLVRGRHLQRHLALHGRAVRVPDGGGGGGGLRITFVL